MGTICPTCGKHASFIRNLTADGKAPRKQEDIIAYDLSCGHTIGGEEYANYSAKVAVIKRDHALKVRELTKDANEKIAALAISMKKEEL